MPPPQHPRDPWRKAPVGEMQEQLLPRWFVILCVVLVPAAVGAAVAAFFVFGPEEVPVAARRPPPANGLSNDVGQYETGDLAPVPYEGACPLLEGVQIAGTETDQKPLRLALAGLCNVSLPGGLQERLRMFAAAGGVVRFAAFQSTGVDSTAQIDADPPRILVNAKLQRTDPLWIAPPVMHDVTVLAGDPAAAETALGARRAEALVCDRLLGGRRESRGCADARALLGLPDPAGALRAAGFR